MPVVVVVREDGRPQMGRLHTLSASYMYKHMAEQAAFVGVVNSRACMTAAMFQDEQLFFFFFLFPFPSLRFTFVFRKDMLGDAVVRFSVTA
jgi:hypothetical protein